MTATTLYHRKHPDPKLPDTAHATQITWDGYPTLTAFVGEHASWRHGTTGSDRVSSACDERGPRYMLLEVTTPDGHAVIAHHGDWLLAGSVPGTFITVRPDVFSATYEAA